MGLFGGKKSKESIEDKLSAAGFEVTKKLYSGNPLSGAPSLFMDDNHNKFAVVHGKKSEPKIYNFSDIIDFEILENGNSKYKGHAGSALVGGLVFGAVGAIAGASRQKKEVSFCKSLSLSITVNDPDSPRIVIPLISSQVKTSSLLYSTATQAAKNLASELEYMQNKEQKKNDVTSGSAADEIKKFKSLLDDGTITQEEFDTKKKQLLGL